MVKQASRPAIVTRRQTEPELILCAGPCGTRSRSAMAKSGAASAVWKRTPRPSGAGSSTTVPRLEERLRRHLKPTNRPWRVDETDVCVRGRWGSLSRALDSAGATIDVVRSGWRAAAVAHRLFRQALPDPAHPRPRVINTDRARRYGAAMASLHQEGIRQRRGRPRPVHYVHTIVEPDHRAITRRVNATQGFRDVQAARRTIHGDEAMHMIRQGHARWVSGSAVRHQRPCIHHLCEVAA